VNKLEIAELAKATRDAAPLRPQALQDAWEAAFIAALTGSAREPYPPEKDEQYLCNRAERIADAAVKRIEARRNVVRRALDKPPPTPAPGAGRWR
jgi:hypothetical protein